MKTGEQVHKILTQLNDGQITVSQALPTVIGLIEKEAELAFYSQLRTFEDHKQQNPLK